MTNSPASPASANVDARDELGFFSRTEEDRLPAMLFLAALILGVLIIGIGFNPSFTGAFDDAITLEVTVVADSDQDIDRPDRAEYLAQASQQGGGNTTEQTRPSAEEQNAVKIDNVGVDDGNALADTRKHVRAADEVLVASRRQQLRVANAPRNDPSADDQRAIALERGSDKSLPLPSDTTANLLIHDDDPRQLVISADTEESTVAGYLYAWKRRIEAVGENYFPELASLDGAPGNPTLEVSISATGDLIDVVVRQSSGSAALDRAALDILRRASPFQPFPDRIRDDYDSLRFAYKWVFGSNTSVNAARAD